MGDLVRIALPEAVRARIQPGLDQEPADRTETPEQAAERLAAADGHRRARWERRLPERYLTAVLGALTPEQFDVEIGTWWGSPARTLLLVGAPGLGKTYAAYAVGNAALLDGAWCECWTATALMIALRPDGDATAREDAAACDLLVLDDLGRENSSGWTTEQMHHLLDVRVAEGRRTIVTTNLSADQITDRYGTAFLDRLIDGAAIMKFAGKSRRTQHTW